MSIATLLIVKSCSNEFSNDCLDRNLNHILNTDPEYKVSNSKDLSLLINFFKDGKKAKAAVIPKTVYRSVFGIEEVEPRGYVEIKNTQTILFGQIPRSLDYNENLKGLDFIRSMQNELNNDLPPIIVEPVIYTFELEGSCKLISSKTDDELFKFD